MMRRILFTTIFAALCPPLIAQTNTTAVPTYAPVPSSAAAPEIPPDVGFRVESLGNGAYMITDGVYQSMFLVTNDSVIAIDAPPTIGHNLPKAIQTVTDLPITHMVYSHAHADHIEAAYLLIDQNTEIIAHADTAKALRTVNDTNRPIPNVTFTGDYTLNVSNQTLELSYKGVNHLPGNIFIYAPVQKVLMLVDVIYPGWVPFAYLAESKDIPSWIEAHDQILTYDFDHVLGGHLNRAGTRDDVLTQREYVTDLFDNCVEAVQLSGLPANATNPISFSTALSGVVAANPGNPWASVRYGDDIISDYCANKTNEKWLGRLAGADVYGKSNADSMTESIRIDYGILGAAGVQDTQS